MPKYTNKQRYLLENSPSRCMENLYEEVKNPVWSNQNGTSSNDTQVHPAGVKKHIETTNMFLQELPPNCILYIPRCDGNIDELFTPCTLLPLSQLDSFMEILDTRKKSNGLQKKDSSARKGGIKEIDAPPLPKRNDSMRQDSISEQIMRHNLSHHISLDYGSMAQNIMKHDLIPQQTIRQNSIKQPVQRQDSISEVSMKQESKPEETIKQHSISQDNTTEDVTKVEKEQLERKDIVKETKQKDKYRKRSKENYIDKSESQVKRNSEDTIGETRSKDDLINMNNTIDKHNYPTKIGDETDHLQYKKSQDQKYINENTSQSFKKNKPKPFDETSTKHYNKHTVGSYRKQLSISNGDEQSYQPYLEQPSAPPKEQVRFYVDDQVTEPLEERVNPTYSDPANPYDDQVFLSYEDQVNSQADQVLLPCGEQVNFRDDKEICVSYGKGMSLRHCKSQFNLESVEPTNFRRTSLQSQEPAAVSDETRYRELLQAYIQQNHLDEQPLTSPRKRSSPRKSNSKPSKITSIFYYLLGINPKSRLHSKSRNLAEDNGDPTMVVPHQSPRRNYLSLDGQVTNNVILDC